MVTLRSAIGKSVKRGSALLLAGLVATLGHCASKEGASTVLTANDESQVKDCAFLSRLGTGEGGPTDELSLRAKVAELGGNTLLLTSRRTEAWSCPDRTWIYAMHGTPTPTPPVRGRIPSPAAPK